MFYLYFKCFNNYYVKSIFLFKHIFILDTTLIIILLTPLSTNEMSNYCNVIHYVVTSDTLYQTISTLSKRNDKIILYLQKNCKYIM